MQRRKFGRHRGIWPVAWLCAALNVSRSGFRAWLNRSPSAHSRQDEVLVATIDRSFKSSDRTYGARRVWHDVLAAGLNGGMHRVERLMRKNGLRARPGRRGLPKDTGEKGIREFVAAEREVRSTHPHTRFQLLGFLDAPHLRSAVPPWPAGWRKALSST